MKSLKEILRETGEYQEPDIEFNDIQEFQYPEGPRKKRWLTIGDLFCFASRGVQAIVWGCQNALAIFIWLCVALLLLSSILEGCRG